MEFTAIHHVALIVSDYQRSKDFYTRILGFRVEAENYRADRNSYKLDLISSANIRLEIFSFPDSPARLTHPEACGLRHLALQVPNLKLALHFLHEAGIEFEEPRIDQYTGRSFTFFADPDGLPLELYEVP